MEIKSNTQFELSVKEVKDIIIKHLMKTGYIKGDVDMNMVEMENITKTINESEIFDGIKIKINGN